MATLDEIFNTKLTENGDKSYISTGDKLLDILFMTEYYQNNLDKVNIGTSFEEKLFSMFIRDPRYGLGKRDLGRKLMSLSEIPLKYIVKTGRFDDIFYGWENMPYDKFMNIAAFMYNECKNGNELAKKWMPRYSSKNLMLARKLAKEYGMNKQQYGKFIKCTTTESLLSSKKSDSIIFEQVPSLAMIKYYNRFFNGNDTSERFIKYLNDVKKGEKKLNVSTTTVYDIYKNREEIDPDIFFEKIEKIKGNWIPIIDTSGSMVDGDAMGKALAIGHYLSKCSTYAPNKAISFSSYPQLITLGEKTDTKYWRRDPITSTNDSQYLKEIDSLFTGDCSNTDFGKVMNLLKDLTDMPEYLIVLSDMEFDEGSHLSKTELQRLWKKNNYTTKIVWWNLNGRNRTVPETDNMGNIYMSGYSPMLLKFLETGFDGKQFLKKLLQEYVKKIA